MKKQFRNLTILLSVALSFSAWSAPRITGHKMIEGDYFQMHFKDLSGYYQTCREGTGYKKVNGNYVVTENSLPLSQEYFLNGKKMPADTSEGCDLLLCKKIDYRLVVGMPAYEYKKSVPIPVLGKQMDNIQQVPLSGSLRYVFNYYSDSKCQKTKTLTYDFVIPSKKL